MYWGRPSFSRSFFLLCLRLTIRRGVVASEGKASSKPALDPLVNIAMLNQVDDDLEAEEVLDRIDQLTRWFTESIAAGAFPTIEIVSCICQATGCSRQL